jgi:uncharacterized protein (TIGR02284 family)
MNNDNLLNQLLQLQLVTSNSIDIYKRVIRNSKKNDLKLFFSECLIQRFKYKREVENAIISLGGKIKRIKKPFGRLSKIWVDVKTATSNNPELTMLENINWSDGYVLELYREILASKELQLQLKDTLKQQYSAIRSILIETERLNWGINSQIKFVR